MGLSHSSQMSEAIKYNRLDEVQLLIQAGVSVNVCDNNSWRPLHHAAYNGSVPIVEYLVQIGATLRCQTAKYQTPLHIAAAMGHVLVVECLIRSGAPTDVVDLNNKTPLYYAVRKNQQSIVECLIRVGAEVDSVSDDSGKHSTVRCSAPMHSIFILTSRCPAIRN